MKKSSLLIVLAFVACASLIGGLRGQYFSSGITERTDKFEGRSITRINLTDSSAFFREAAFGFTQITTERGDTNYYAHTYLYQSDWLFSDELAIQTPRGLIRLKSDPNSRVRNVLGQYIEERNLYPVTLAQIKLIASNPKIKARLYGQSKYIELTFNENDVALLRKFISKVENTSEKD